MESFIASNEVRVSIFYCAYENRTVDSTFLLWRETTFLLERKTAIKRDRNILSRICLQRLLINH